MKMQQLVAHQQTLLTIFKTALQAINGQRCVAQFLGTHELGDGPIRVLAVGKAAYSMALGAQTQLHAQISEVLIITRRGCAQTSPCDSSLTLVESDHPIPTQLSLLAGHSMCEFLQRGTAQETLLILMSGGSSALVEALPENMNDQQLRALNRWLLAQEWPIDVINHWRQTVSLLKWGRARQHIRAARAVQLSLSDVEGNDIAIIGSGLFYAGDSRVINTDRPPFDWLDAAQARVRQWDEQHATAQWPVVEQYILADNSLAREAAVRQAQQLGLPVILNAALYASVSRAAEQIAEQLRQGPPGLYIWGGETVLQLPENCGQGGRCQSLALAIALLIARYELPVVFLACGTDGSDGPGDVAGAIVDAQTIKRGRELGLNAEQELASANAGYFLEQTGNLIDSGPTGSNVQDLLLALKYNA